MKLSDLREGEAGRFTENCKSYANMRNLRFVVVKSFPEDCTSGGAYIITEHGNQFEFVWDYDSPEVEKIGTGRVETRVIIEETV